MWLMWSCVLSGFTPRFAPSAEWALAWVNYVEPGDASRIRMAHCLVQSMNINIHITGHPSSTFHSILFRRSVIWTPRNVHTFLNSLGASWENYETSIQAEVWKEFGTMWAETAAITSLSVRSANGTFNVFVLRVKGRCCSFACQFISTSEQRFATLRWSPMQKPRLLPGAVPIQKNDHRRLPTEFLITNSLGKIKKICQSIRFYQLLYFAPRKTSQRSQD